MSIREPTLSPVRIADLRPTQMTIGFREVEEKRQAWRARSGKKESAYLGSHMIPVVAGPKGRLYVTDHHHMARAMHEEGVVDVLVNVISDLSALEKDSFWVVMDCRGWCHPYDANGVRQDFSAIPVGIADLVDDPFRSLAGALRRAGGFAKDVTPFSEFLWADFLRHRMKRKAVEKDFDAALTDAVKLAKGKDAGYLPGWCGPVAAA
ncbi:MAG TPA: ParB-like protein [Alphaproteobacteria bacterium]|jgi:hypothetical protein|nr:ParB-like protein [Alphaproteobacteria bacterium]